MMGATPPLYWVLVLALTATGCSGWYAPSNRILPESAPTTEEAAAFQLLYRFSDAKRGVSPDSIVVQADGTILGTTVQGGEGCSASGHWYGCGVLFELVPLAGGYTQRTVHMFSNDTNGASPNGLVAATPNLLYGSTQVTWPRGCGTIFGLSKALETYVVQTIYSFDGNPKGPCGPGTIPIAGPDGSIYGTTKVGGTKGFGTVFKLARTPSGYVETTLYSFPAGRYGKVPNALLLDRAGNLYGEAAQGVNYGSSIVFELAKTGSAYSYHVVRDLGGQVLSNGLVVGRDGRIYGTIGFGSGLSCGAIFTIDPAMGNAYHELYRFRGGRMGCLPTGLQPLAGGSVVGTTSVGGFAGEHCRPSGCGMIFELRRLASGYTFIPLHEFRGIDGEFPLLSEVLDGSIYGTTNAGGSLECVLSKRQICGAAFKLTLP